MNILAVDDDLIALKILEGHLRLWGYDVLTASNGLKAWDICCKEDIRFVVSDWNMPKMDGLELTRKIRAEKSNPYCYIILLTANNETQSIVKGIESGADDYITKPFDMDELKVRVRAGKRIIDLQQELLEANDKLERMAKIDPLTGLYNRWAMVQNIRGDFDRRSFNNLNVAFIMTDIDKFKTVNDTHGHDAGDVVIKEVAGRLQNAFRQFDFVCRLGGDEFFIIAPNVEEADVESLADRARRSVEETPFDLPDGSSLSATSSFGVFYTTLTGKWDIDRFMKIADNALYESKSNGRNCVTVVKGKAGDADL